LTTQRQINVLQSGEMLHCQKPFPIKCDDDTGKCVIVDCGRIKILHQLFFISFHRLLLDASIDGA